MGEIKIDPKFNIYKVYRTMNITNPYRFGSAGGATAGVQVEYQAVLDFASNNSIALPSTEEQAIHNQKLADLKSAGVWSGLSAFGMLEGTAPTAFKLIDWKRLVIMTSVGGVTWSTSGAKGNGSTGYIETGLNILNDTPTITAESVTNADASLGLKIYDHIPGGGEGMAITRSNSGANHFGMYATASDASPRIFSGAAALVPYSAMGGNLNGVTHSSIAVKEHRLYKDGVLIQTTLDLGGGVKFNYTLRLLTFNNSGGNILYASSGIGWFYVGASLNDKAAQVNTILK